jgi:transposase
MSHGLMDQGKIDLVIESASRSAGVLLLDRERETLMAIAEEAGRSLRAFTTAKTALEKLSLQTYAQRMAPTVGKTTAAIMATFVGDPALFPAAAAYLKACGLNLKEKSSGKLKGHLKITKRGPGRVRQYLWLAACRWIRTDKAARAWFERKVARDAGKKSKALVALMRKLALALFHVGRGDPYDASRLFDLKRLGLAM